MTYEVQFKLRDAEYTVRGPDTAGILALIDGLQPKSETPKVDPERAALNNAVVRHAVRSAEPWFQPKIEPDFLETARKTYAEFEVEMPATPLPEIEDPHAELRKTWAPGQKWLTRSKEHIGKAGGQWLYVAGGEPHWYADQEYRRAPEDGWITWTGGDCPLHDADVPVDYRMRDGAESTDIACTLRWGHTVGFATATNDIVAYRTCA